MSLSTRNDEGPLIQAAEYYTQKFTGRLRPIVFLREDIFDSIDAINDKNKLKMDCSRTLMWDEETLGMLCTTGRQACQRRVFW
jgi:hypothetical protein